jgi:GNAT superfamily N-acetyltransferase
MKPIISKIQEIELENINNWYNKLSTDETENLKFDFTNDSIYEMKMNEEIIGIMSISIERYSYYDMKRFILKKYRGKKFGEEFLCYLIKMGKENNITRITGTIKSENIKGNTFLESKGFEMRNSGKIEDISYKMGILKLK